MKLYTAQELADIKGVTRQTVYWAVWTKRITPVANGAKAMIFDEAARETFLKMRPGRRKIKKVKGEGSRLGSPELGRTHPSFRRKTVGSP